VAYYASVAAVTLSPNIVGFGSAAHTPLFRLIKEVLRRENQGLKVYPVDGSSVSSMTGTYFRFILSMLSGLIFKKNA